MQRIQPLLQRGGLRHQGIAEAAVPFVITAAAAAAGGQQTEGKQHRQQARGEAGEQIVVHRQTPLVFAADWRFSGRLKTARLKTCPECRC